MKIWMTTLPFPLALALLIITGVALAAPLDSERVSKTTDVVVEERATTLEGERSLQEKRELERRERLLREIRKLYPKITP